MTVAGLLDVLSPMQPGCPGTCSPDGPVLLAARLPAGDGGGCGAFPGTGDFQSLVFSLAAGGAPAAEPNELALPPGQIGGAVAVLSGCPARLSGGARGIPCDDEHPQDDPDGESGTDPLTVPPSAQSETAAMTFPLVAPSLNPPPEPVPSGEECRGPEAGPAAGIAAAPPPGSGGPAEPLGSPAVLLSLAAPAVLEEARRSGPLPEPRIAARISECPVERSWEPPLMTSPGPADGEEPVATGAGAAPQEGARPAGETAFALRLVARPPLPLRPEEAAGCTRGTAPEAELPPDARPEAETGADRQQAAEGGAGRVPRTGREGPAAESNLRRGADPASMRRPESPGILYRAAGAADLAEPAEAALSSPDPAAGRVETQPGTPLDEILGRAPVARRFEFRVPIAGGSMVDLLLTDKAGSLQVAVRGREAETVGELRRELGTLVDNLRELGFRTEAWNPLSGPSGPLPADRSGARDAVFGGEDPGAGGHRWGAGKESPDDDSRHQPPPQPLPGRLPEGTDGEAGPDGEQEIEEWLQRLRV